MVVGQSHIRVRLLLLVYLGSQLTLLIIAHEILGRAQTTVKWSSIFTIYAAKELKSLDPAASQAS